MAPSPWLPPGAAAWDARQQDLFSFSEGRFNPEEMARRRRREPPTPQSQEDWLAARVSVVCPTTDSRQEFHGQLWAVFDEQDWPDKELIVVETYTDRPSPFLTEKAKSDERLVFVSFRVQKDADWSIGLKRNMCTHLASGIYLANFDDDDLYAPIYLQTMVHEMLKQKSEAITLTTYYIFDGRCGKFGWVDQRFASDSQRYGFGFSYVFLRGSSLAHPYPNQNMGEDFGFFNTLRLRRHSTVFGGARHVALHLDECGICCHTLHPKSTSGVYAKHLVPDEEIEGLDIAGLSVFGEYLGRFEKTASVSGYIGGRSERREQKVKVHVGGREVELACAVGATARELLALLHPLLLCGGQPEDLRLHRSRPPPKEPEPEAPAARRKLRALALHGAASNSNVMKFQTTMLRKSLGEDVEWIFPVGPMPWAPQEDVQEGEETTGTGIIQDHFAKRSAFEERIADGQPFTSWFELDPDREWKPTEDSKEAAVKFLMELVSKEAPIDLVVAFQQSTSLMNVVSERFRRASGQVPWRMNIHVASTPCNDSDTDQIEEPLPTPTAVVDCSVSWWYQKVMSVYPKLYASLEVLEHQDGFLFPFSRPRAADVYATLAEQVRRHCSPSSSSSSPVGPPALRNDERVRMRDVEFWATLPAERQEEPCVTVRVSDMRYTEVAVNVKVHAIETLGDVRLALLAQHGSATSAGRRAARGLKLAERFGKCQDEEGYYFKGCDLKQWLLDRREFFAMGLQELLDQTAQDHGLGVQVRLHAMGVKGFMLVEVPAPGRLRELRAALAGMLPEGARAFPGPEEPPEGAALAEDARLPAVVLVEDFRSPWHLKMGCFEGVFLERGQALRAQERMIEALRRPEAQAQFDRWEAESEGDQRKYRAKMGAGIHEEVYRQVLEGYGLPRSRQGVLILSQSIRMHYMDNDKDMVGSWLETERLCRNHSAAASAERAYARLCA